MYRIPPETEGGPSFYSGHVVVEWQQGQTTFHLTMHGHEHEPEMRLMAAALIEQVKACASDARREKRAETCGLVFGHGSVE